MDEGQKAIKRCCDKKLIDFIDGTYGKMTFGVNSERPAVFSNGEISPMSRSACVMNNSQRVKGLFSNIEHKFTLLYAKRAFVYHYCASGMEEGEFTEAVESLAYLEKEYEDIISNE
jgi:tubulin alpha